MLLSGSDSGFEFLGYVVDLLAGEMYDSLKNTLKIAQLEYEGLQTLLLHYSRAEPTERAGHLVKFSGLPGGQAYERAFLRRAVQPIAEAFGQKPQMLVDCVTVLGGVAKDYGDSAAEIFGLPRIPLVIILWEESEFPAEANILFDDSASRYLPTEDLAVLGEIAAFRLIEALNRAC